MRNYRKKDGLTSKGAELKKGIMRNRTRAKNVGLLYLLAIVAFAAVVAALPLFNHDLAPVGVMEFWKAYTEIDMKSADGFIKLVNAIIYTLMLLVLVVNVLRSLRKLGWLFRKVTNKASKTFGFNHNVYAMEDLSSIFSGSFAMTLFGYFLIVVLCGDKPTADNVSIVLPILLVVGFLIRLFGGLWGAKTCYFDVEKGGIVEEDRVIGRTAPFFRNFFQLCSVFAMMYFFLQFVTVGGELGAIVAENGLNDLLKEMGELISVAMQVLIIISLCVLTVHATGTTEYSIDGTKTKGMKNFRVFSFFVFLFAGVAAACTYLMVTKEFNKDVINMLIVAGIALVMFIIELIMRKYPKFPSEKKEKVKKEKKQVEDLDGEDVSFENAEHSYAACPYMPVEVEGDVEETEVAVQPPVALVPPMPYPPMMPCAPICPMAKPAVPPCFQVQTAPVAPVVEETEEVKPEPEVKILPIILQSAATPEVVAEDDLEDEVQETVVNEEVVEKLEVDCPFCEAKLRINSTTEYHRCPACDKVFRVRKKTRIVK